MKMCPIANENCQSWLKIYPNTKLILNIFPSTCNVLPGCRYFAKSGHSEFAANIFILSLRMQQMGRAS